MLNIPSIADTIKHYNLTAQKSLGQNFLYDLNITNKIAKLADTDDDAQVIIEIGPGPGALTRSLLEYSKLPIIAIEKDKKCVAALAELQQQFPSRLNVVSKDAMEFSLQSLQKQSVKIVANLPYNIGTRLLLNWFQEKHLISQMVLMFQKEVAERLVAQPNSKSYGRLSIITQLLFEVKIAFFLPNTVFSPPPKVASAVVIFIPKTSLIPVQTYNTLQQVTACAFRHRRKMLYKNLIEITQQPKDLLKSLSISCTCRAEDLTPQQFLTIAQCL